MRKINWKPLTYNGLDLTDRFLVSDSGEIYSLKSKKILKQVLNKSTGYYGICTSLGSREDKMYIKTHIAVACMFVGGRKDGLVVNHKDGNKKNNNFKNLEWVTIKQNCRHAVENGFWFKKGSKSFTEVVCINTGESFDKIVDAAKRYNIKNPSNISDACRGVCKYAGKDKNGNPLYWRYKNKN